MPAKNLYRVDEDGIYSHIYNKGVEQRIIFNDDEDYKVFLGFLKDYLTPRRDPESIKKNFKVHGRTFRGTPHQPKNYFNQVELIAYNLMPDHFHLLLYQKTRGSIESLIRSLCTRYSIYFNKKYKRRGALFEGPYKSIQIKDKLRLLYLSRHLHLTGDYSSYPDYLDLRETSWVKPQVVLSFLKKGTGGYKDFVEKYELDQKEKGFLEGITFESETQHLQRRDFTSNEEILPDSGSKPHSNIPHLLAISSVLFVLLLTVGIGNITLSKTKISQPLPVPVPDSTGPTPAVLSETEEVKPKVILTVKIDEESASVNIRQKPTIDSEKIGKAKDGDTFEFISLNSGWYEVKLEDASTGFISENYVVMDEENN